jgi:hypothetical protein
VLRRYEKGSVMITTNLGLQIGLVFLENKIWLPPCWIDLPTRQGLLIAVGTAIGETKSWDC